MPENTTTTDAAPAERAETTTATAATPEPDALGDAGKKALQAEREARKEAEKQRKSIADELEALKATIAGREAEHQAAIEAQRIKDEALAVANKRIVAAEIRVAAKGILADPEDALAFIDTSSFEVSPDGAVDQDAIAEAISALLAKKPHLAARGGTQVPADPSQGGKATGATSTAEAFAAAITAAL